MSSLALRAIEPHVVRIITPETMDETPECDLICIASFPRIVPPAKHPRMPWAAVAVYNGNGINHEDNNNNKDVAGTVKFPLDQHNTVGLSAERGDFKPSDAAPTFKREAAGIDYQYVSKRFFIKMEALAGRNLRHDIFSGGMNWFATDRRIIGWSVPIGQPVLVSGEW